MGGREKEVLYIKLHEIKELVEASYNSEAVRQLEGLINDLQFANI